MVLGALVGVHARGLERRTHFHHGGVLVRKSVSVHGESTALPSTSLQCARASESGAGPRITLPVGSYCEPWHGHMYLHGGAKHTRVGRVGQRTFGAGEG